MGTGAQWLGWMPQQQSPMAGMGAGLEAFADALTKIQQQKLYQQDLSNMMAGGFNSNQPGTIYPNGIIESRDMGAGTAMPQSRQMQQMLGQAQMQNMMLGSQPMTPYQKAMSDAAMARATQISPTQMQAKAQAEQFQKFSTIPKEKRTPPEQAYIDAYMMPRGPAQTNVTVNTGAVEKSTKGMLEKELVDLNKATGDLENVRSAYQDKFSEYAFRGRKWLATTGEKLGISAPDVPGIRASKDEITAYTDWYQTAKGAFLTFRKWATGVAGGQQEMNEIKTAFPEPDNLSPTEFRAAIDASIKYRDAYRSRLEGYLKEGKVITPDVQKEITRKALIDAKIGQQSRTLDDISKEELDTLNAEQLRELQDTGQLSFEGIRTPQVDRLSQQGRMIR